MLIPFWTLRQVSHFTEFGLLLTQRLEERRWQRVQTWSKGWWCSLWILLPGWPLAPVLMCGGWCLCCQLGPLAWQRSSISQLHLDNMLQTLITSHLPSVSTWIKKLSAWWLQAPHSLHYATVFLFTHCPTLDSLQLCRTSQSPKATLFNEYSRAQ